MVIGQLGGSCVGLRVACPLFQWGFWLSENGAGSANVYFGISGELYVSFGGEKVDYFLPNVELKENYVSVLFLPMYLLLGVVFSQIGCSFPIGN